VMCMSVCLGACLCITLRLFPQAYLRNYASSAHRILCVLAMAVAIYVLLGTGHHSDSRYSDNLSFSSDSTISIRHFYTCGDAG